MCTVLGYLKTTPILKNTRMDIILQHISATTEYSNSISNSVTVFLLLENHVKITMLLSTAYNITHLCVLLYPA